MIIKEDIVEEIDPKLDPVKIKEKKTFPKLNLNKKQKVIFISIFSILFLLLISYSVYAYQKQTTKEKACTVNCATENQKVTAEATPTPVPKTEAYLNGELVEVGSENLNPLAVIIENHPDARPQAGLGQANLVYEAIAEGGITRFLAIYQDPSKAVRVGPIRSARTYFVDVVTELKALFGHVGGNYDALSQISSTSVLDLDQFSLGEPVYKRDFSRGVALEHTMYSSTEKLLNAGISKYKLSNKGDFGRWKFKDDQKIENRPETQTVSVSVSDSLYDVVWKYNKADNLYYRSMAGSKHIDANTQNQITAKNIVLQKVEKSPTVTQINEKGWAYQMTGEGDATIIMDGIKTTGTWKKQGTGRTYFFDNNGKEIALDRGTTWVQLTHSDSSVVIN